MNSQPELKLVTNDCKAQQLSSEERLEDYLENLGAPLIGVVPYRERRAFRQEAHAHLDGLLREYGWQGKDLRDATECALREFGDPWKVGQAYVQEWLQGTSTQRPALLIRKATYTAFGLFGISSMLTLLLLEQYLLSPTRDAILPCIGILAFIAPFVAGGLVGAITPAQGERGVRNAVLVLAPHAFITGLFLQPRLEGIAFAGWLLLFWLPTGRVCAAVAAHCVWQVRRQRFWRTAR